MEYMIKGMGFRGVSYGKRGTRSLEVPLPGKRSWEEVNGYIVRSC